MKGLINIKRIGSVIVPMSVIAIIAIIIVPLDTHILDFLLLLSLTVALIILLISMSTKRPLDFSIFPSLLLITTLYRLSLEISATRLILTKNGNAGAVIGVFGHFVGGDNVLVGVVIFLIIVVVQFLVITKGSERVAEVAARFTLDAMPGKQMAIDADLNSGLITEDDAKQRRKVIQREADFFGAMDGASKFVKGDAIVAIVIMVINIVGGVISGILKGEEITLVFQTYTLATIGEGLMAQLPALLISTATGIIVTRTASEDNMSLELSKQLFSNPLVLRTAGIVLLGMMLLPGFPVFTLLILGSLFIFLSFQANRTNKANEKLAKSALPEKRTATVQSEVEMLRNPENVYQLLEVENIEMEFGYSLIPLVDESQGGSFIDKVVLFRRQFALDTGIVIPSVRMRDSILLNNNQYIIKIRGEEVANGELLIDHLLVMSTDGEEIGVKGIDTTEPAFGLPARWIPKNRRDEAELLGYTVIEAASVMMTHLGEVIRRHVHELIGRKEVNSLLDMVKRNNQTLVDEVVPGRISVGDLQRVLQNLLREQVPIRDMISILECISEQSSKIKDIDLLTEYVRQSLKRTISHKLAPQGELKVLTIDPQVEKMISSSVRQTEHGAYLALEPDKAQNIIQNLNDEVSRLAQEGYMPVIIVSPVVRMYFKKLTEQIIPELIVISYNELENNVRVQAVGAVLS